MKALFARVKRFVRTRRRLFAVVLAALAVWAGLAALRPPEPTTASVLVTSRPVSGGSTVSADDVQVRQLPVQMLPADYFDAPEQAVGRPVTVPLPAGAIVLPSSVVSRESLAAPGMAVLPVTLSAAATGLVVVGDRLDLIGLDEDSGPVASAARVVAVLDPDDGGGSLSPARSSGLVVLVELRPDALAKVAAAAARGPLGFGFR